VLYRDGVYYYVRRVPYDLTFHYDVKGFVSALKPNQLLLLFVPANQLTNALRIIGLV
jgi:hypothetical protein